MSSSNVMSMSSLFSKTLTQPNTTAFIVTPIHRPRQINTTTNDRFVCTIEPSNIPPARRPLPRPPQTPTTSRMRNVGGFHLPPTIPATPQQIQRAIELLGAYTQRKRMRATTRDELESLIGHLPPNRLKAQQWKVALHRHHTSLQRVAHRLDANAFRHRDALALQLPLPHAQTDLSRVFILLEVMRKRYSAGTNISPRILDEVSHILGACPATATEARRHIRALALMQRQRRRVERRPPVIPLEDLDALRMATMLLGAYAVHGSVGAQTAKLVSIIGAAPRNKNVAASWKKIIAAAIRKKKRKDRVVVKRALDDEKRLQRRLKRLKREQQVPEQQVPVQQVHRRLSSPQYDGHALVGVSGRRQDDGEIAEESLAVASSVSSTGVQGDGSKDELNSRYLSRLGTLLGRFFMLR